MKKVKPNTKVLLTCMEYVCVLLASSTATYVTLRSWRADFRLPISFDGDATFILALVRALMTSGWVYHHPLLGVPFGLDFYDYPLGESLHIAVMLLISFLTDNPAVVVNTLYIASYPLAALTAYATARYFKISRLISLCIALLFSCSPYHLLRGVGHYFYSLYYVVPLATLLAQRLFTHTIFFDTKPDLPWNQRLRISPGWTAYTIIVCLLLGLGNIYFAFFSIFFFAIALTAQFLHKRDPAVLITGIVLTGSILFLIVAQHIPNYYFWYKSGRIPTIAQRYPVESELYGLKIAHLLIPPYSPVQWLNTLGSRYHKQTPPNNDQTAYLGLAGGIGFLLLLGALVFRWRNRKKLLEQLSILNGSALLLAMSGAVSSLIAFTVFTQIRAYNRISIFILFFSLLALGILANSVTGRLTRRFHQKLWMMLFVALTAFSFYEQTAWRTPNYTAVANTVRSYERLVRTIEQTAPSRAMIFQLPYKEFPESEPIHHLRDYDLLRPLYFSNSLRWSYGSMKGRPGDVWHQNTARLPEQQLLDTLGATGFSGILIDTAGFPDGAKALTASLSATLKRRPLLGGEGRLVYFDISDFWSRRQYELSDREKNDIIAVTKRPAVRPGKGFYPLETDGSDQWTWCAARTCTLQLVKFDKSSVELMLRAEIESLQPATIRVVGNTAVPDSSIQVRQRTLLRIPVKLSSQITQVTMTTDGSPVSPKGDSRTLYFRLLSPRISLE